LGCPLHGTARGCGVIPEHLGKDEIDLLIYEEIKHISILVQKRRELKI
jgi:hypothetical protein